MYSVYLAYSPKVLRSVIIDWLITYTYFSVIQAYKNMYDPGVTVINGDLSFGPVLGQLQENTKYLFKWLLVKIISIELICIICVYMKNIWSECIFDLLEILRFTVDTVFSFRDPTGLQSFDKPFLQNQNSNIDNWEEYCPFQVWNDCWNVSLQVIWHHLLCFSIYQYLISTATRDTDKRVTIFYKYAHISITASSLGPKKKVSLYTNNGKWESSDWLLMITR